MLEQDTHNGHRRATLVPGTAVGAPIQTGSGPADALNVVAFSATGSNARVSRYSLISVQIRRSSILGCQIIVRTWGYAMAGPSDEMDFNRDSLLTLLNVYTAQLGSYTTMLWQVPALGLAAQAFLMMIVLGSLSASSDGSKYAASALSIIIAVASVRLMYTQRGRAINHNELAKRISSKLSLDDLLGGDFTLHGGVPMTASAEKVWAVNHFTYRIWMSCMALFIVVDALVIISTAAGFSWFT